MSAFFLYQTHFLNSSSYCNVSMMNKRKKYLLGTLFVFTFLIVTLSQVSIWETHLTSAIKKKMNHDDWNIKIDELSGNFISTIVMKDLIFDKKNGERIIIDKISINLGIFTSLFKQEGYVLDLFDCTYYQDIDSLTLGKNTNEEKVENLVVLGGSQRISNAVAQEAGELAGARVWRIAGRDRYSTSVEMAKTLGGWWPTGRGWQC